MQEGRLLALRPAIMSDDAQRIDGDHAIERRPRDTAGNSAAGERPRRAQMLVPTQASPPSNGLVVWQLLYAPSVGVALRPRDGLKSTIAQDFRSVHLQQVDIVRPWHGHAALQHTQAHSRKTVGCASVVQTA